ncbi:MAG TPA: TorF family putative porin [Burkholderiales bacterium]|nr:TorF family putative porin [Burkholderiales bacterium]
MRKTILSASLGAATVVASGVAFAQSAAPAEPKPPYSITANVTLASEYLYRGIAQTRGKPAIQGGFDFTHTNGFYIGTWASNISWIQDGGLGADGVHTASAPIEIDTYGGYRGTVSGDLGFDVGFLRYNYPGSNKLTGALSPDTDEIYGALSYKWISFKYSRTVGTSLFGFAKDDGTSKTTGAGYFDLTGTWDLGSGFGLSAHVGHQSIPGLTHGAYTDYKLGVTKDVGFGTLGAAVSATNAHDDCSGAAGNPFCFGNVAGGAGAYSSGKSRLVLTFGKTF